MSRTPASPAVVVLVHDGFYGCGTGAGASNHAFLQILAALIAPHVHLAVLPVRIAPASTEYDPDWHQKTLSLLTGPDRTIMPLDNGTHGVTRFGGLASFRAACHSAAVAISRLSLGGDCLIIASDVPFFGLSELLPSALQRSLINVARSTAALHAPGETDRIAWERHGLLAAARAGGRIAAISQHMHNHLTATYQIPDASVVHLTNGLTRSEQQPPRPASGVLPPGAARGFLFALGRAEPYKGFTDLLDALVLLREEQQPVPHTVLAAVTDGQPTNPYQQHLAQRIQAAKLDVTLLTRFSSTIRTLLAHPALAAVIVPSRAEPFGRVPLDTWAAGVAPVVATTAGGLAEQVADAETGFTAAPHDPRSLACAIRRALVAAPGQRSAMITAGRRALASRYDYETNIRQFIDTVAPWAL